MEKGDENGEKSSSDSDGKQKKLEKTWDWVKRKTSGPRSEESYTESAKRFSSATRGYSPNIAKRSPVSTTSSSQRISQRTFQKNCFWENTSTSEESKASLLLQKKDKPPPSRLPVLKKKFHYKINSNFQELWTFKNGFSILISYNKLIKKLSPAATLILPNMPFSLKANLCRGAQKQIGCVWQDLRQLSEKNSQSNRVYLLQTGITNLCRISRPNLCRTLSSINLKAMLLWLLLAVGNLFSLLLVKSNTVNRRLLSLRRKICLFFTITFTNTEASTRSRTREVLTNLKRFVLPTTLDIASWAIVVPTCIDVTSKDVEKITREKTMSEDTNIRLGTDGASGSNIKIEDIDLAEADIAQKFLRGYIWDGVNTRGSSPAIESSIYAKPFPDPPPLSIDKDAAFATKQYSHLFKIVTPIKVDTFEALLVRHPNRPFVDSVLKGLRCGFWPNSSLPSSDIVEIPNHISCEANQILLEEQCQDEIDRGRYSQEFTILLEGMKVIPLLMVSKKDLNKMQVCSNMSAGNPAPNELIDKKEITPTYDSLKNFIPYLIEMKETEGDVVMIKSDVETAFQIIPLHYQYQMRQIMKIRDKHRIDHNLTFGSSASPHIWCGVFSLVLWIAEFIFNIKYLNAMMDDVWAVCPAKNFVIFKGHRIPLPQAKLLQLWDHLGIPWVWKKQIHGTVIEIIGHVVDSERMLMYLEAGKKEKLVQQLRDFVRIPKHLLKDWQGVLGSASWGCTSMPWGRFALQSLYEKIGGKTKKRLHIPLNKENQHDLQWLIEYFNKSDGIQMLSSLRWGLHEADCVFFTDACMSGIGI